MTNKWKFQAVPEIFDDLSKLEGEDGAKVSTQPHLALTHRAYPSDNTSSPDQRDWTRLATYLNSLNEQSPDNVSYKLLYLTRHGLGYHNQKHTEVGTEAWEAKWSLMDGEGDEKWFDAKLTEEGVQQAKLLSEFWQNLFEVEGVPYPQTLYTSPLTRCLQTTSFIFGPLIEPFEPIVKDDLRERWTLHTCDKRRDKSWLETCWEEYVFEEGFPEEDTLGVGSVAETDEEHRVRKQRALEDIWNKDQGTVLSLTIHSIAMRSLYEVLGAPTFRVREGTSVAVLVKGEKL